MRAAGWPCHGGPPWLGGGWSVGRSQIGRFSGITFPLVMDPFAERGAWLWISQ